MLLAISQEIANITITVGGSGSQVYNDMIDYTFDTSANSGTGSVNYFISLDVPDAMDYVGIAGHNLGSLGCKITIENNGVNDVVDYEPIDDRPIMFDIPQRAGSNIVIEIVKPNNTDVVTISHIACGKTTDLTGTTTSGQSLNRDYEAGYSRIPMAVNRKVRATVNQSGAPTATLTKTVSAKMKLNIKNMPTPFAKLQLLEYQNFWVNNGFFMQNDGEVDQSYMAFQFTSTPPKAHPATRDLVNLSYQFLAYNGQ